MRVITGSARGQRLQTLVGQDVRPTTDRVKEAIFSIIQFEIAGRNFLDLFAGSGQMGIEALSRGASSCTFVDERRQSIDIVKNNLKQCDLIENSSVVNTDAKRFLLSNSQIFDIVYLDPPYSQGLLDEVLPLVSKNVSENGIIICESSQNEELLQEIGDFRLDRIYRYGKIKVTTYRNKGGEI